MRAWLNCPEKLPGRGRSEKIPDPTTSSEQRARRRRPPRLPESACAERAVTALLPRSYKLLFSNELREYSLEGPILNGDR
jgi:hypothetical protein